MAPRKRNRPAPTAGAAPVDVQPAASPTAASPPAGPEADAPLPATPEAVVAAYLRGNDLDLAAAALLPWLDSVAPELQPACRQAATLIRTLMQDPPTPEALPRIPDDLMAGALRHLTAQIRRQEAQIERLQSILARAL